MKLSYLVIYVTDTSLTEWHLEPSYLLNVKKMGMIIDMA